MLGIVVNEMTRSLSGAGAAASRDALFHYQITHRDQYHNRPQMHVAIPGSGYWSTQHVVPWAAMDNHYETLPKRYVKPEGAGARLSRDALLRYEIAHQNYPGPQMRVADPSTGWWSTERRIPMAFSNRAFHVVPKHRGLGDAPDDFEAAIDLQYTPVRQGWIYGEPVQGFPHVSNGAVEVYSGTNAYNALSGPAAAIAAASDEKSFKHLVRAQRIQTALQVISTLSIASLATMAIGRAISESRAAKKVELHGRRRLRLRSRR